MHPYEYTRFRTNLHLAEIEHDYLCANGPPSLRPPAATRSYAITTIAMSLRIWLRNLLIATFAHAKPVHH